MRPHTAADFAHIRIFSVAKKATSDLVDHSVETPC